MELSPYLGKAQVEQAWGKAGNCSDTLEWTRGLPTHWAGAQKRCDYGSFYHVGDICIRFLVLLELLQA